MEPRAFIAIANRPGRGGYEVQERRWSETAGDYQITKMKRVKSKRAARALAMVWADRLRVEAR